MVAFASSKPVEEIVSEAFNFSVDKLPLSGPDNLKTPFYGLFRSDNGQVVHSQSVTSRYVPHTTEDIVGAVRACSSLFDKFTVNCHFDNGHYVEIIPDDSHRIEVYHNDTVFPRLLIRAGYDGNSYRASMGWYRDLCKNLHIMRMVDGIHANFRHTNGLNEKIEDLIEDLSSLKGSWEAIQSTIHAMRNRTVNMASFLTAVYGEPKADEGRGVTIHKNRTEAIFRRLMRERLATGRGRLEDNFEVSAWEAFNAVQGYVQHDATRRGKPDNFTRMLSAINDSAVKRAEELALSV